MIFITGDNHANFTRFRADIFPEQREMNKDDYVIVCGDFGVWDDSPQERYWFDWLNDKSFTTLFVTGNHSNYDLLKRFHVSRWNGGKVQHIRESVIHLMRGQVCNIRGKSYFAMGGASSHDISGGVLEPDAPDFHRKKKQLDRQEALYRINHISWWREELPDDEEYEAARKNPDACGWSVDYIVSHCCPSSIVDIIGSGHYQYDRLTDFFDEVKEHCQFRNWFFGHYHENRVIEDKFILLYEQIVQIE